jgi:DNA-binding XRE family transcriptional regulator
VDTPEVTRVKTLYNYICNRAHEEESLEITVSPNETCKRVRIIEELEKLTGREFKNTKEFHHHVSDFLMKNGHLGSSLKECRKRKGMSQRLLAFKLGVSQQYVAKMESGSKPLIPKALDFIEKNNYTKNKENP